jgi:hypothetical protein
MNPDDQEVSGVAHLLDHADFVREARSYSASDLRKSRLARA